jgi:DHA2 family multidrug resistance protein
VPLALVMTLCLRQGIAVEAITVRPPSDRFALLAGGSGLALIYGALGQGNRLDWLNSGFEWGLLLAGSLVLLAFFVHEARTPNPLVNLKVVLDAPIPSLFVLVAFLRLTILATSYLIPLYLGSVRGYRDLEVGDTLVWIAIPQLLICPIAALILRRSDPRLLASIGFIFISVACLMVAYNLTPIWGSTQFLPSALMQAVGQSFALSGVIFFGVLHLKLKDALTFGAVLQTARLMGGEIGSAFVTTLARVREQVASNLIGLHVYRGDARVLQRIGGYGATTTHVIDPVGAAHRGQLVLGNVLRAAATTQAVMDGFVAVGFLSAIALLILVFRGVAPPGPASPVPLFPARGGGPP